MPDTIPAPHCGDPARITERFWLDPTDGPVEHLQTGCLSKHWFTPRADTVQSEQVATAERELAVLPSRLDLVLPAVHRAAPELAAGQDGWRQRRCACAVGLSSIRTGAGRPARVDPATTAMAAAGYRLMLAIGRLPSEERVLG
jgi:hypothetical protein